LKHKINLGLINLMILYFQFHNKQKVSMYILFFIVVGSLFLFFTKNDVFAWHQNMGMSDSRAAELYITNQNDPQIKRWQQAMMNEYSDIQNVCFVYLDYSLKPTLETVKGCLFQIEKVFANCATHPNSLILCQDQRFEKFFNSYSQGTPTFKDSSPSTPQNFRLKN